MGKTAFYQNLGARSKYFFEIMPPLGNCDNIINHWHKELMTLFPGCKKEWAENQHLFVEINKKPISIIITADDNYSKTHNANTIIFISKANVKTAKYYYATNKTKLTELQKIDDGSFLIINNKIKVIQLYHKFTITKIRSFLWNNLVEQSLSKTRSKGGQNSIHNLKHDSVSQAKRKSKKVFVLRSGSVIPEIEENMKAVYEEAFINKTYDKSYMQFTRDLRKDGAKIPIGNGDFAVGIFE